MRAAIEISLVVTSPLVGGEDLVADRRVSLAAAAFFVGGAASSPGSDLRFCESTERSLVEWLEAWLIGAEGLAGRTGGWGTESGIGRDLAKSEGLRVDDEVMLAAARRMASSSARLRGVGATLTRPMMMDPIGEVADAGANGGNVVENFAEKQDGRSWMMLECRPMEWRTIACDVMRRRLEVENLKKARLPKYYSLPAANLLSRR